MWGIDDYIALVVEVTDGVKPHIAKKKQHWIWADQN